MNKTFFVLFLLSIVFCGLPRAGDELPAWALPLAEESVAGVDPVTVPAVCLCDFSEMQIAETGMMKRIVRRAHRILSADGSKYGVVSLPVGPNGKVKEFRGWVRYPNGEVNSIKNKDMIETQLFESSFFTEYRQRVGALPNVGKGSFVCFEYEMEEKPLCLALHWYFQAAVPVRRSELVVRIPAGAELTWKAYNLKDFQPVSASGSWIFRRQNVPQLPDEPCAPPAENALEQVAFRVHLPSAPAVKTWEEVAGWYYNLTSARWKAGDPVTALAETTCAGSPDQAESIRRLTDWVQSQIRYVAVSIGLSGMIPQPAEEVVSTKYGDCKGKAFLLMLLLRSRGVMAWPVLCQSRDDGLADPEFPLASDFNHCIVAIQEAPGKIRFFDPTCESVGWPALPLYLRGTWGLLIREKGGELVRLECLGADPRIEVKASVDLSIPGLTVTKVQETYANGALSSLRATYRGLTEEERHKKWQALLSDRIPDCRLKTLTWKNLFDPDKDLILEYELESRGVLRQVGALWLIGPFFVLDFVKPTLTKPERQLPVALEDESVVSRQEISLMYPKSWQIEENLEPVERLTDFGTFKVSVNEGDNQITLVKEIRIQPVTVPAERYKEAQSFFQAICKAEQQEVLFKVK